MSQPIREIAARATGEALGGVKFYLLRREYFPEFKYKHLLDGWPDRLRNIVKVEEEVEYFEHYSGHIGRCVVGRKRRFCGWGDFLNPTIQVMKEMEVGPPFTGQMEHRGNEIKIHFEDQQVAIAGTYVGVRMIDSQGQILDDFPFDSPLTVGTEDWLCVAATAPVFS
jgi:hypothetical protein